MDTAPSGVITLLTDFGTRDHYVAVMKGVILGIAPHARLIDITHDVAPQAISEASYLLDSSHRFFPRGTIHLVIVDPGVGSERRGIAVATRDAYFVGPDNGVLAPAVERARVEGRVEAIELSEPRFWLDQISRTFHGRDIFAPVAAHLLAGVPFTELGRTIDALTPATTQQPYVDGHHQLRGEILHVDRFGNCITNITTAMLYAHGLAGGLVVDIAGQRLHGFYRTYSEAPVGVPMVLVSSSGHMELAIRNGSAARALGVVAGDRLKVSPGPPPEQ